MVTSWVLRDSRWPEQRMTFCHSAKKGWEPCLWWSPSLLDGSEWGIGVTLQRKGGTWNRHELGLPISLLAPKKNLLGVWVCGCKGVHVHAHPLSYRLPGWHEFLGSQVELGRGRLGDGRAGRKRKQAVWINKFQSSI